MSQLRPWRAVDPDLFRFATTELRDPHIGLMSAFDQAAMVAPAPNQVRGALRTVGWEASVDDASLQRALAALVGWGLLDATQDHGAVYTTPEEFERNNLQWSLTPKGEAGISALDSLKHTVGLQPAVLDAIGDGLAEVADLLDQPSNRRLGRLGTGWDPIVGFFVGFLWHRIPRRFIVVAPFADRSEELKSVRFPLTSIGAIATMLCVKKPLHLETGDMVVVQGVADVRPLRCGHCMLALAAVPNFNPRFSSPSATGAADRSKHRELTCSTAPGWVTSAQLAGQARVRRPRRW